MQKQTTDFDLTWTHRVRAHDHDVGGLHVAVDDPVGVDVVQSVQHLPHAGSDHCFGQESLFVSVFLDDGLQER